MPLSPKQTRAAGVPLNGIHTASKAAFLVVPPGADTEMLRHLLAQRQIVAFSANELDLNGDDPLIEGIRRADLVIVAGSSNEATAVVARDCARRLNKPLLLLTAEHSPADVHCPGVAVLRAAPADREQIEFWLDLFLAAPGMKSPAPSESAGRRPLGAQVDALLAQLDNPDGRASTRAARPNLEDIVLTAAAKSGYTLARRPPSGLVSAVWCDDLDAWMGNPLLLCIRDDLSQPVRYREAAAQLQTAMTTTRTPWGVLIYGSGPAPEDLAGLPIAPNILPFSARELLEGLRKSGFGELIRRQRNQRVHRSA